MKTYIKFCGAFGSGKTFTVRKLTEYLTGVSCDYFEKVDIDGTIEGVKCKCGKVFVMGKWNPKNKCCGVDAISGRSEFKYRDRVAENIDKIPGEIVFDEGIMNASIKIQDRLDDLFNYYTFFMDYTLDKCAYNIGVLRNGKVNKPNIQQKIDMYHSIFPKVKAKNKYTLSGNIDDNMKKVIEETKIVPCKCMQNDDFLESIIKR